VRIVKQVYPGGKIVCLDIPSFNGTFNNTPSTYVSLFSAVVVEQLAFGQTKAYTGHPDSKNIVLVVAVTIVLHLKYKCCGRLPHDATLCCNMVIRDHDCDAKRCCVEH
jgi:hypothetical protein